MILQASDMGSWSRVGRDVGEPRLARRGWGIPCVAVLVLTLVASACQSGPTGPTYTSKAYLEFTVQPPVYSTVGQPLSAPVKVSVVDATGRTLRAFPATVTITLGADPDSATLSGTTSLPVSEGEATFSDLSVDRLGTYTLVATVGGLPTAASEPFEVQLPPTRASARTDRAHPPAVAVSDASE